MVLKSPEELHQELRRRILDLSGVTERQNATGRSAWRCKDDKERGLSFAQIGRELNLDEETVAKWARQKTYSQRLKAQRKSKLDPYKPIIQRWLEQHPYSATQIFQRLRAEQAYTGGISILTDYV